jgi:MscS family membrane protein
MPAFLEETYYDNTVLEWLIAAAIILGSVLIGKIFYWLCSGVVRRLTAKTSSKIDDIIVDMVEEPIVVAMTVAGIWIGLDTLSLPSRLETFIDASLQFVVILCASWLLARLVEAVFSEVLAPIAEKSETDLDDQLLPLVRKGSKMIIWSVGVIVALNNAGYDVGALIAGLGMGGLALAMAAKDTVSNIFGGFTVFTDRPFAVGDRIRISGFDGTVKEVGVRSTRLVTLEGRQVTIPNMTFSDSAVENVTLEPSRKVVVDLGLTYDTTPEKMREAMEILRALVASSDALEDDCVVGFDAFGDSAMVIKLIYYIKKGEAIMASKSAVNMHILEHFAAAGLDFAFPTQHIYHQAVA